MIRLENNRGMRDLYLLCLYNHLVSCGPYRDNVLFALCFYLKPPFFFQVTVCKYMPKYVEWDWHRFVTHSIITLIIVSTQNFALAMVIASYLIYNCFQLIFLCLYQVILHQLSHPRQVIHIFDIRVYVKTAAWISCISVFFK